MSEMVLTRTKSRFVRELNAILAITAREIACVLKSPGSLFFMLAMPVIMMGMIGGNLMENMVGSLNFAFGPYMLVGMLVQMLFMVTSNGVASLVDDHDSNFSEEMLIAPVSRYSIVVGKICGSMFSAIVSMAGTLLVGAAMGITLSVTQFLLMLLLSPLICLSGGALAMIFIGLIKNKKTANMAVMMIVMAQMFLSGTIIPIQNSSGVLFVLSRILPMTYCLDLARAVIYSGTSEYATIVMFNPGLCFAVIAVLTVLCLLIGTFFFARSEKNR